jgi:predicted lipoprotein with Yx(FWY)xxD motif
MFAGVRRLVGMGNERRRAGMSRQTLTRTSTTTIAGALLLAGALAAIAVASGLLAPAVRSASNARLATKVVVNARGRTLYALTPETSRRLLCKSAACLGVWPPLTVASNRIVPKAGAGVAGRLGLVRRGAHSFQVTLRGMPLYRFSGDRGPDESNGDGIHSFGGTWHATRASSAPAPAPMSMQPSSTGSAPGPYAAGSAPSPSTPTATQAPTTTTTTTTSPTSTTPTTPTYTYPPY